MYSKKYDKTYEKLKVLVTGTTGFKGSWLVLWLNMLNAKVVGVALKPEKNSFIFKSMNLDKNIKQYYLDISNFNKLDSVIKKEKPDIVFHLAAQSVVSESYNKPLETINTNVIGSLNVLESCRLNKIFKLVLITSDKCYFNKEIKRGYKEEDELGGHDVYSSSKAAVENIFYSYNESFFKDTEVKAVTARAGNVIGGGDFKKNRIVPDIARSIQKKKTLYIRNPNSTRPWQHVLEPVSGYLKIGELILNNKLKEVYPSYNFGPHQKNCKNVKHIMNLILSDWKERPRKIIIKKDFKFRESKLLSLNISKAKKELKWEPTLSLNDTIKYTVDWYKTFFKSFYMKKFSENQIEKFINYEKN